MVRLGEPLFAGRTAGVYAWGEGTVVKLYRIDLAPPWIERERTNLRVAAAAGLRVPVVGAAVDVEGRRGFVQERVDGETLQDELEQGRVGLEAGAHLLARLHAGVLRCPGVATLWSQRQVLTTRLAAADGQTAGVRAQLGGLPDPDDLAPGLGAALRARLARLPDGDALCHGDLHPRNVIQAAGGPCLIDWIDATRGRAAATWPVASSCSAAASPATPPTRRGAP